MDEIFPYDQVVYNSSVHQHHHIDQLAVSAQLHGIETAPIERCRVLELACGTGEYSIALASALPQSRFVAIDVSSRQIEIARQKANTIELSNLDLVVEDLIDTRSSLNGEFDYIVAHGVYSWVTPEIQEAILSICKSNLAENGIAMISYNVFPGWYAANTLRELFQMFGDCGLQPKDRIDRAKRLAKYIYDRIASERKITSFQREILVAIQSLSRGSDSYIFHEYLEGRNEPLFYRQFVDRCKAQGLKPVCDAFLDSHKSYFTPVPEDASEFERIQLEQVDDVIYRRQFRKTIVTRSEVLICRKVDPNRINSLYVVNPFEFKRSSSRMEMVDGTMSRDQFLEAIQLNGRNGLSIHELINQFCKPNVQATSVPALQNWICQQYFSGRIRLRSHAYSSTVEIDDTPMAFAYAVHEARNHLPYVTNVYMENIKLSPEMRDLIVMLDGSRNTEKITLDSMKQDGGSPGQAALQTMKRLQRLARFGLLVN